MSTRSSHLRTNSTDAERHLWQYLRNRQHPLPPYVVDFVCLEHRLVVELDGGQHAEALTYDAARTQHLQQSGYVVLRFWNHEALGNTQEVLTYILQQLTQQEASA